MKLSLNIDSEKMERIRTALFSRLLPPSARVFWHAVRMQVSAIEKESIDIDPDTKDLLDALDFKDLPGIAVSATPARM